MYRFLLLLALMAVGGMTCKTTGASGRDGADSRAGVKITPIFHGSLVLQWQGKTILVDPYNGAERYTMFGAPDLVVITHPHGDHLDTKTLQGIDLAATELIAPQAVIDQLGDLRFGKVTKMENGQRLTTDEVGIEAIPMYNLPEEGARHAKGWGNGYVLTFGKERFYLSGDTEGIPEMRQLNDIDVAFVCMNLPYTMDVDAAAEAVLAFRPEVIYPYHYRNGDKTLADVARFKELVEAGNQGIEVRLKNWYPGM